MSISPLWTVDPYDLYTRLHPLDSQECSDHQLLQIIESLRPSGDLQDPRPAFNWDAEYGTRADSLTAFLGVTRVPVPAPRSLNVPRIWFTRLGGAFTRFQAACLIAEAYKNTHSSWEDPSLGVDPHRYIRMDEDLEVVLGPSVQTPEAHMAGLIQSAHTQEVSVFMDRMRKEIRVVGLGHGPVTYQSRQCGFTGGIAPHEYQGPPEWQACGDALRLCASTPSEALRFYAHGVKAESIRRAQVVSVVLSHLPYLESDSLRRLTVLRLYRTFLGSRLVHAMFDPADVIELGEA